MKVADGTPAPVQRFVVAHNWSVMANVTTVICIAIIVGALIFVVPAFVVLFFVYSYRPIKGIPIAAPPRHVMDTAAPASP